MGQHRDLDSTPVWPRLRSRLLLIRADQPGVLRVTPGLDADDNQPVPPFHVSLTADGEEVAAGLYRDFGADVQLRVGALPYPRAVGQGPSVARRQVTAISLDPREVRVGLDGPLTVVSGATVKHALLLTNHTKTPFLVDTTGTLFADIVDPVSGRVVGGFSGWARQPLVTFPVGPGTTTRIPLLVETASFNPDLGYRVPPGNWQVTATMDTSNGRRFTTPPLPLTITPASDR
jgi:hypothetical protein